MFKLRASIVLISFLAGCASHQWKQPLYRSPELPLVFDTYHVLGTGLKLTDLGYHSMPCLESFETERSGGKLEVEFFRIDETYPHTNSELDHFIAESRKRAKRFNLRAEKPVSFGMVIRIDDRLSAVREETIRFREDVEKLIYSAAKEQFYRTCGTEFINTVLFDSRIFFFFSYYPKSPEGAAVLEEKIRSKITQLKENVLQLNIFSDTVLEAETFFSLQVETDNLFEPIEFHHQEIHGKKLDDFLNKLVRAVLTSDTGNLKRYVASPWSKLNQLRDVPSLRGSLRLAEYSDEAIFKSLQLLENSVMQFRLRHIQLKRLTNDLSFAGRAPDLFDCSIELDSAAQHINWPAFNDCRFAALSSETADLESIAECFPITAAIAELNVSTACLKESKIRDDRLAFLNDRTHQPFELVDRLVEDPLSIHRQHTGYRFNDAEQVKVVPKAVVLGQGVDKVGRFYSESCMLEETKRLSAGNRKRDIAVTNDYYPVKVKEWPLIKKVFLFWRDSPEWTLYRGSFQVEGFSPRLLPSFEISEEAKKLAQESISRFYHRYGTHYVERIRHRRGFVYYFSPDPGGYDDIEVLPFGMARPAPQFPLSADMLKDVPFVGSQDRICSLEIGVFLVLPMVTGSFWDLLYGGLVGTACRDNVPEILKPKTVQEFYSNKRKIIALFEDDSAAIPVKLSLKPWSEYLVNKGILHPSQLDLADLAH